jgi:hypothetical protein
MSANVKLSKSSINSHGYFIFKDELLLSQKIEIDRERSEKSILPQAVREISPAGGKRLPTSKMRSLQNTYNEDN